MPEYEWAVELHTQGEEDFETDYAASYALAFNYAGEDPLARIKLVRRDNDGSQWEAFVHGDTLDPWFRGPAGQLVHRTPKRFHKEVEDVAVEECHDLISWAGIPESGYTLAGNFHEMPNGELLTPGTAIPTAWRDEERFYAAFERGSTFEDAADAE